MNPDANKKTLIATLEKLGTLCDRYSALQVINCDPHTGQHLTGGGNFSVVFRAFDHQTESDVAVKFFDPDKLGYDNRRYNLFERECILLDKVQSSDRCLKLISKMNEMTLSSGKEESESSVTLPCRFFVTEWIEDPLDTYFFARNDPPPVDKLKLFRGIVLAVNAMHQNGVFHRDLKIDNFRLAYRDGKQRVVAIDYGAAAIMDIARAGTVLDYISGPVGMGAYSPIEAHTGLSIYRELAPAADMFGLGAILYELFSQDLHFDRQFDDSGFLNCFGVCQAHMTRVLSKTGDLEEILKQWHWIIEKTKRQVNYPDVSVDDVGNLAVLVQPLNQIIRGLSHVDYRERWKDLDYLVRRIDSMLRLIENERKAERLLELKRQRRQNRLAKLSRRAADNSSSN